jgi:hypothetical protein
MPHKRNRSRFRFLVSPITTSAVDVQLILQLAEATDAALRTKANSLKLDGIVLFPIVTEQSIYPRADFITHKKASKAFYVGQNIEFNLWKRARRSGRVRLALRNFRSSVEAIPDRHLKSEAKTHVLGALERAAKKVLSNAA